MKQRKLFGRLAEIAQHHVSWQLLVMLATAAGSVPFLMGCVAAPMASKAPSLVDEPRLEVTPSSISFSSAIAGEQSSESVKLSNTGEEALTVTGVIASGAGLSIGGFSGSKLLNPGTSSTLTVQFTPNAAGAFTGSVSVLTNTAAVTAALPVTGEVAAAKLTISVGPSSLSFGSVAADKPVSQEITLTNTGNSDVTISQISVSGAAFSMTGGSAPVQLGSSQSITVDVKFDPRAAGTYTGMLKVASDASDASVAVPLSGSVADESAIHSVGLSWDPSASKVSGYNVYRSGASAGPFARLNGSLVSGLSFADDTVAGGLTYYYVTTAVDSEGIESNHSNTAVAVVP